MGNTASWHEIFVAVVNGNMMIGKRTGEVIFSER